MISKHVLPDSIIYTDGWKGYKPACEQLGFEHHVVNHSKFFKDPITCVHTNSVEGCNNGHKLSIPYRNRTKKGINKFLAYYIWRKQNVNYRIMPKIRSGVKKRFVGKMKKKC